MNALMLKNALDEVVRDYHETRNDAVKAIKEVILQWYYTTYITAEECVELLVEYITHGTLSLRGKFEKKF